MSICFQGLARMGWVGDVQRQAVLAEADRQNIGAEAPGSDPCTLPCYNYPQSKTSPHRVCERAVSWAADHTSCRSVTAAYLCTACVPSIHRAHCVQQGWVRNWPLSLSSCTADRHTFCSYLGLCPVAVQDQSGQQGTGKGKAIQVPSLEVSFPPTAMAERTGATIHIPPVICLRL